MNPERLLTQTAVVTERIEQTDDNGLVRDEYGNVQIVETVRTVDFWYEQLGTDEAPPIAEQTGTGYFPPGDPITAAAKVTSRGVSFEVMGIPDQSINPRTRELGLVRVALKRTTG